MCLWGHWTGICASTQTHKACTRQHVLLKHIYTCTHTHVLISTLPTPPPHTHTHSPPHTHQVQPDGGHAWVSGHDVVTQLSAARQMLGYCPQFDALPGGGAMTGRQVLYMYAR